MKLVKYVLFYTFFSMLFYYNVNAQTCSYKEQTILNNDLANVKITYEVVNDNEINILIYNITENIFISFEYPNEKKEQRVYYNNTNNGKYVITRDATSIEEYDIKIKSDLSACYGNILSTKKIIKPKYNEFHTLDICSEKGLENHSYCQKFVTRDINKTEEEVIKILKEFLSEKVEVITTTASLEKSVDLKTIIIYSITGIIMVGIIIIVLIIKKKRNEL